MCIVYIMDRNASNIHTMIVAVAVSCFPHPSIHQYWDIWLLHIPKFRGMSSKLKTFFWRSVFWKSLKLIGRRIIYSKTISSLTYWHANIDTNESKCALMQSLNTFD